MVARLESRRIIGPDDIAPSQDNLTVVGAFNPGVVKHAGGTVLLVRVAEAPREQRSGYVALPRWDANASRTVIDWLPASDVLIDDPRMVTIRSTGLKRLPFISHLVTVRSRNGRDVQSIDPSRFLPDGQLEEFGVEDPRVTLVNGRFYFTYVAVSRHGAATALAVTSNFRDFTRLGVILPPENKDVVLFPDRIRGQYFALHRPNPAQHFRRPEMWMASSPDLVHWGHHIPILSGDVFWETDRVGAGAPPIRTHAGWLEIYHSSGPTARRPSGVGSYCAGAALMDLDNPQKVIGRCSQLLVPETEYERHGFMPDVVFPTGIVSHGDTIHVYYGAADQCTAVTELRLHDVLRAVTE